MQPPQTDKPEFSRLVALCDIPPQGFAGVFQADETEKETLSSRFDLLSLSEFSADIRLVPLHSGELELTGSATATLSQSSVVTMEPVISELNFPLSVLFTKEPPDPQTEEDVEELTDPLDIGEVLAQCLGIALDPYPRNPGEEFLSPGGEAAADEAGRGRRNPFAILKKLQDQA